MTVTSAATGLVVQQWESDFFRQYLHDGGFKALMGSGENSVIQVKEDLTKKDGDSITIALVNRLTNAAVTGVSTLEGSEEAMKSRSMRIYVDKRRNAVLVPEMSEQKSAISLRNAARPTLLDWMMEDTRGLVIKALGSINGDISFTASTEAQRDAYLVDNVDRIVFGAVAAPSASDMSAALDELDTTADKLTTAIIDAALYKAKTASPFAHPAAFADLRASMTTTLASTASVMEGSKLFEGGDLHWNGCIIKEVDDLPVYTNLGTSATNEVTPVYLVGAQALAIAYAKRPKTVTEEFDYGDKNGVAVECIYGVRKVLFGTGAGDTDDLKDHGVVTIFVATTAAGNTVGIAAS
jgi:N4-gp56 family major capsid protein